MKYNWLTFLFGFWISAASFGQSQTYSLFDKMIRVTLEPSAAAYALPDSFIVGNSERVVLADTVLLRGRDYDMDYTRGRVIFRKKRSAAATLEMYYQALPLEIKLRYSRRQPARYRPEQAGRDNVAPAPIRAADAAKSASTLKQNGSIVRGVSLGTNQGLKLDSGLRMQISGKIADRVEIVAALTDQTTPIQPEGNTQTLQEIDKVFIELKSDRFQATLGDYYLGLEGTEFSPYHRKLQGAMGSTRLGHSGMMLYGAVSKGKFISYQFTGQEGNQGPYQLKGDRGQIDIIVLAGTEKVWIDGQLMTRGETNDYIIEYSNGQITFTRRRLITADSRITVDFQFSDQKFQRSLYGMDVNSRAFDDKIDIGVRVLREADNEDNPLDYILNTANRSQLEAAGDSADSMFVSGVNYLGPGKGSYVAVDSASIRFYRYVGPNLGDYNIAFTYLGPGRGDYKSVGYSNYRYVGEDKGSYKPVIYLTPAQSHDLVDVSFNYRPKKNILFASELAMSRLDKNVYSARDDQDNAGLAMVTQFGVTDQPLRIARKGLGSVSLKGSYRKVQRQFNYIDRSEEVEKSRKWDYTQTAGQSEEIVELDGGYSPLKQATLQASLGQNQRGDDFRSRRWELRPELRFEKFPRVRYHIESINSRDTASGRSGDWIRQQGSSEYHLWKLRPAFDYLAETKKETYQDTLKLGFRYYQLAPSLKLTDWNKMSFSVSVIQRRQDKYVAGHFQRESDALTQAAGWQLNEWKNLSFAFEYTHRERTYTDSIGAKKTDLADFKADYSPLKRAIHSNWHYQLSNTQVARQERVYLKVERGAGNYRYDEDLNEYIPDALTGDYILQTRTTDDFVPVVELRASCRVTLEPERLMAKSSKAVGAAGWKQWFSALSGETFVQLEEKTRESDVWAIYRLDQARFQQEAATLYGVKNFRQDVYWNRNHKNFSLRFRFNRKADLNNQYLEGSQQSTLEESSLRMKGQLSPRLSTQLDFGNRVETKTYDIPGRSDKDIISQEVIGDFSFRPKQSVELALKVQWTRAENRVADLIDVNLLALSPRVNYAFRGKGRLRIEVEFNRVNVQPEDAIVPYEMVSGYRHGANLRWLTSFDYNVSRYIRASLSWNGRYEEYLAEPVYTVRAEMRAYF
ncbi:MAG: hypothetical protein ACOY90_13695 [Candidatus Zhuqueibacterota bacterium]